MDKRTRLTRQPSQLSKRAQRKGKLAFYVLLTLFVVVGAVMAIRLVGYGIAREEYAAYQAIDADIDVSAATTEPELAITSTETTILTPTARPFYSGRVAVLQKENRDTVGWIDIIGTGMQYPVVKGADNDYYMTRTFKKKKNASGAIFMDCWNASGFTDFNTVIYGHNMKDGSMFAGLREYRNQAYFDEHPFIEVTLLNKELRYRVFAAYTSQGEDSADFRGQNCTTEERRASFIKAARRRSDITSTATVSRHDRLLTLVTCTSGTHPWFFVVHAVLVEEES
jgi:sortase B